MIHLKLNQREKAVCLVEACKFLPWKAQAQGVNFCGSEPHDCPGPKSSSCKQLFLTLKINPHHPYNHKRVAYDFHTGGRGKYEGKRLTHWQNFH